MRFDTSPLWYGFGIKVIDKGKGRNKKNKKFWNRHRK